MSVSEFIGWPNEGIEYWNAHWRGQAAKGFFDETPLPCSCGRRYGRMRTHRADCDSRVG